MIEKKALFNVGTFRFENELIDHWVDIGGNIEYFYELEKTGILPLNQNKGLLSFTFHLEMKPIGEINFSGDCMLTSTILKSLINILRAKKDSEIRKRNKPFMKALNKLLLRRCLNHSREIGENDGFNLIGFETLFSEFGLENISFNKKVKKTLVLKEDRLIEKKEIGNINNINEKIKQFAKKEAIDLVKITARLEKDYFKCIAHYPKPVILKDLTINGILYHKIIFKKAIVYSKEKVPPNCLSLPKIYKVSILEYDSKKLTAKLLVKKRK